MRRVANILKPGFFYRVLRIICFKKWTCLSLVSRNGLADKKAQPWKNPAFLLLSTVYFVSTTTSISLLSRKTFKFLLYFYVTAKECTRLILNNALRI